jgi:Phytanoyl-CoA dioxygenase (PhyH)
MEETVYQILELAGKTLEAAATEFEAQGFIRLGGVGTALTDLFESVFKGILDNEGLALGAVLQPLGAVDFSLAARRRISKVESTQGFAQELLTKVGSLLSRLIGPIVHVSSTYHVQVKGGGVAAPAVDHGGYPDGTTYLEPFGQYLLHQDFTGANIPTSPSAVTLWVPLNDSPDWNLRIYPGSHRKGMLCNAWVDLDTPGLSVLGKPVDIRAERGTAVVFNAMDLHGTSNPGIHRRVSCDIRFFPLCGFLPSRPWFLGNDPLAELDLERPDDGPVLRTARLEGRAYLGRETEIPDGEQPTDYQWARYVAAVCRGDEDAAEQLSRYANPEVTGETGDIYVRKFHGRALEKGMLDEVQERLKGSPAEDPQWLAEGGSAQAAFDASQQRRRIHEPSGTAGRQPELG